MGGAGGTPERDPLGQFVRTAGPVIVILGGIVLGIAGLVNRHVFQGMLGIIAIAIGIAFASSSVVRRPRSR